MLFLDEPTLGLDPQTTEHIWKYIKELSKRENSTMVRTTRYNEGTRADSFILDAHASAEVSSLIA
jgi:ABC-type multidrug transport system ATPase subunit